MRGKWIFIILWVVACAGKSPTNRPVTATPQVPPPAAPLTITIQALPAFATFEQWQNFVLGLKAAALPDLLVIYQIDDPKIIHRLVREHLKDLGFQEIWAQREKASGGKPRALPRLAFLSRLKAHGKPQSRGRQFLTTPFLLPDGRGLTVIAVDFASHNERNHGQLFQDLKGLRRSIGKDQIVIAAGQFDLSPEEENKFHWLERVVHPDWLVSPVLLPVGRRHSAHMILMSKDVYDGTLDWRLGRDSIRAENLASISLHPAREP